MSPDRTQKAELSSPRFRASARGKLLDCIAALRAAGELPREACEALEEKLGSNAFNLVVVGHFKRGETGLTQALIAEGLLPAEVVFSVPLVTQLAYSEQLAIEVSYEDAGSEAIGRERLPQFITETGNPGNEKRVREIAIAYPWPWLTSGVTLVDTPGIGPVYPHNTGVVQRFLPKADAVLVLNKPDLLSKAELRELIGVTRRAGADVAAGTGKRFPGGERDDVQLASIARHALRLISQARFEREVELKALSAPLEELQQKMQRFEMRRQELAAARDEHLILLKRERERLLREVVEKDLAAFEADLVRDLSAQVQRNLDESRHLSSRTLQEALHREAMQTIRQRLDRWRLAEHDKVSSAFRAVCRGVAAKLDRAVDDAFRFAADLFAIRYEAIQGEAVWMEDAFFHSMFWDQPGGLYLIASAAILALPKLISRGLILRRAREAAIDAARTQSARVRYDFQQGLEKSLLAFQGRMSRNVEAVLQGLEEALREAAARQHSGETEAGRQRESLAVSLRTLDEARARLEALLQEPQSGTPAGHASPP